MLRAFSLYVDLANGADPDELARALCSIFLGNYFFQIFYPE